MIGGNKVGVQLLVCFMFSFANLVNSDVWKGSNVGIKFYLYLGFAREIFYTWPQSLIYDALLLFQLVDIFWPF